MKKKVQEVFDLEINTAKILIKKEELDLAFNHLERAHILGQSYVIPHSLCHLLMLKVYFLKKEYLNSLGQVTRLILGILGSSVDILPIGNTGGSNISMFKKMDVPSDLKEVLEGK